LSDKQKVDKILFVDIKSGKARLSAKQKKIKTAVEEKHVEFKTYKP
jgi:predicted Holliday junction resolvase-like endonuclease